MHILLACGGYCNASITGLWRLLLCQYYWPVAVIVVAVIVMPVLMACGGYCSACITSP